MVKTMYMTSYSIVNAYLAMAFFFLSGASMVFEGVLS